MSASNLNVGEQRLSRAKVASILAGHDEHADVDKIGYYDSLDSLAAMVRSGKNWAEGEIFVSAFENDRYVIMKQVAPSSCELATYTQNGFHDVLTGYRFEQDELVEILKTYAARPSTPSFSPSDSQVRLAQALLVAQAHEAYVRPIVESYQREILERHQFKMCAEKAEASGDDPNRVILDPRKAWLIGKEDLQVYYAELAVADAASGLPVPEPGMCPLLVAEHTRIQCENALIDSWKGHEHFDALSRAHELSWDTRKEVVDLSLQLMVPFMKDNAHDILKDMGIEPPSTNDHTVPPGADATDELDNGMEP
jgi:hypothetical protein